MGGLIVMGDGPEVLNICSGGFLLDAAYSPQRLSELAKMDGATILAADASRIARANVHLVPEPDRADLGDRYQAPHRRAVARSINVPVITVSQRLSVITVYAGDEKHEIEPTIRVVNRANQALQTLERYRNRLDTDVASLSTLEIEDFVTVRDVVDVLQRAEGSSASPRRSRATSSSSAWRDAGPPAAGRAARRGRARPAPRGRGLPQRQTDVDLDECSTSSTRLSDRGAARPTNILRALRLPADTELDCADRPRGFRLISRIPRLPDGVIERIVARFGALQKVIRATIADLDDVEGVGETRAVAIKEGLSRLAESSILDRYS